MDRDKRKRSRVPAHFDIRILLGQDAVQVQIINVSLTGILCTTDRRFQRDDTCTVVISLREDLQITIDAKIIRVGTGETAISFSAMDEESFSHLKKVVQYNTGDADRIEEEFRQKAFD